ncbi:MAG: tetratricopeptide repeat protein [Campylobacterales bacterium]|nr:tetratricopeptide repeat protein [Campylobacterales bacterium]
MSNRLQRLHSQCRSYHLKRSLKGLGLFIVLVSLPFSLYYIYEDFSGGAWQQMQAAAVQTAVVEVAAAPKEKIIEKKTVSPSYLSPVSADEVEKAVEKIQQKKAPLSLPAVQKPPQKQILQISENRSPPPKKSTDKVYFSAVNEDKSLDEWVQKYDKKKSYAIAIYISRQYYFNEDFKNAGIWAKKANQLDRNKEDAWLLYAKSVFALGDKEKAKKILNVFLQYKDSAKAEMLLSEWEN